MEKGQVRKKDKGKEPEKEKSREKMEKEKRKEVEKEKIEKEKGKEKGKKEKSKSKEEMRKEWETEKKQLKGEEKKEDNNVLAKHLLEQPVSKHQCLGPLPKAIVWCSGRSTALLCRAPTHAGGNWVSSGGFFSVDGRECAELRTTHR